MTLASDPFGLIASAAQQARPATVIRNAGAELWRGFQRLRMVARRDEDEALPMAEISWQAGFAAMWQQEGQAGGKTVPGSTDRRGMEFL